MLKNIHIQEVKTLSQNQISKYNLDKDLYKHKKQFFNLAGSKQNITVEKIFKQPYHKNRQIKFHSKNHNLNYKTNIIYNTHLTLKVK